MKKGLLIVLLSVVTGLLLTISCRKVDIPGAPNEKLEKVSNLQYSSKKGDLTLTWELPKVEGITGIQILKDGTLVTESDSVYSQYYLKKADTNVEMTYTVKLKYGNLVSLGQSITFTIQYEKISAAAYLLTAASIDALPSQNEQAGAKWFQTNYVDAKKGSFIYPNDLPAIDVDECPVIWIYIDRMNIGLGWQNLPESITSKESIDALKKYVMDGGNLYLAKHATQLLVPIGRISDDFAPNIFSDGATITGDDVWTMNANIGKRYDHTGSAFFSGVTKGDPNGYGYKSFLMTGPGEREDHNCMWDCNAFGLSSSPDVIYNFEKATNSSVLATWGHVTDFCCAGVVEFKQTEVYLGKIFANGMSAYQFYMPNGNAYQSNIERFTSNILNNYMK